MSLLKEYCYVNRVRCHPKRLWQRTLRQYHVYLLRSKVKSRKSHDLYQWSYTRYFKSLMRRKNSILILSRTSYKASYYPYSPPKSFGHSSKWYRPVLPCFRHTAPKQPKTRPSPGKHSLRKGWIWWINRRPIWSVGRYRKPVYMSYKRPYKKVLFRRNRAKPFSILSVVGGKPCLRDSSQDNSL
jgi:hypothetical protein